MTRPAVRDRPTGPSEPGDDPDHRPGEHLGWKLLTVLDALAREVYLRLRPDDPRAPAS